MRGRVDRRNYEAHLQRMTGYSGNPQRVYCSGHELKAAYVSKAHWQIAAKGAALGMDIVTSKFVKPLPAMISDPKTVQRLFLYRCGTHS